MKRKISLLALSVLVCSCVFSQVASTADSVSPLLIGRTIPTVALSTSAGQPTSTDAVLTGKKSILVFYRGGWCPYCNAHLKELQNIESQLIGLGYQIIAISPDASAQLVNTFDKDSLKYQLFSDAHTELIRKMGIAFMAPSKYGKMLSENSAGGNDAGVLPAPAVFIVDKTGKIVFEYVNPDFKHRMSGKLLLAAATALAE